MTSNNPVVLVDSLNLAFRMHFSQMHLQNKAGTKTGVIYGMLKSIIDLTRKLGVCDIIWFWEGGVSDDGPPVRSWRKALATDYKGNRKKNPDRTAILKQAHKVKDILEVLGYAQFHLPGIEADDLIGVVSNVLSNEDSKVYILSTDRDFLQCVDENVSVLRPGGGKLVAYTPKSMFREFGVKPDQWAAYKALVGDTSDNYKGVEGVGPASAIKMLSDGVEPQLSRFATHPKSVIEKYGAKLEHKWEDAFRCYQLSYIPRSVAFSNFTPEVRQELKQQLRQLPSMRRRTIPRARYTEVLDQWTQFCSLYELSSFLVERRKFFATAKIV